MKITGSWTDTKNEFSVMSTEVSTFRTSCPVSDENPDKDSAKNLSSYPEHQEFCDQVGQVLKNS